MTARIGRSRGGCKLDNRGRFTIPASFRETLSLKPGAELLAFEEDGRLLLMTREQAVREAQAMTRKLVAPGVSAVDELFALRREDEDKAQAKEARLGMDLKRLQP